MDQEEQMSKEGFSEFNKNLWLALIFLLAGGDFLDLQADKQNSENG